METSIIDVTGKLVVDYRAREWCKWPYGKYYLKSGEKRYTHPQGCPNYGKRAECPPQAPLIQNFIYLDKRHWLIVIKFNLKDHAERMKLRPRKSGKDWTEKQAKCNLYWQRPVIRHLRQSCIDFCGSRDINWGEDYIKQALVPEATGLHIIKTAKRVGIPVENRPKRFVHKIALIGYPKINSRKNVKQLFRRKRT